MFAAGIKHLVLISLALRRSGVYKEVATYFLWRLQTFIVSSVFEEQ